MRTTDVWGAITITVIILAIAALMLLTGCAHNQLVRVNGWAVTTQGVFVGECTVLNGKDNIGIATESSSGDTAQKFTFQVGDQTSGYDVELAEVKREAVHE